MATSKPTKIYFSPQYAGGVYLTAEDGGQVMMDRQVVSTEGLLGLLSLRLGLHFEPLQQHEAIAHYYGAMATIMPKLKESVLSGSFQLSPLATAKAAFRWRNELRLVGCRMDKGNMPLKSSRLNTLIAIEDEYRKLQDNADMAEQTDAVLKEMESQQLDCSCYELCLPCDVDQFRPLEQRLLTALQKHGATVSILPSAEDTGDNLSKVRRMLTEGNKDKIKLASMEQDKSILVYEFADEHAAHEYLSLHDMGDVDVWINPDNKQMDNWLYRMDKPMTGSHTADGTPQIIQLFVMGVSLFHSPLDINTFVEWLNVEHQPLPHFFRRVLASKIAETGGYRNDECREIVEKYINGDYEYLTDEQKQLPEDEQHKLRLKDMKKRQQLAKLYLPADVDEEQIDVERLRNFADHLSSWAAQRTVLLHDNAVCVEQFHRLHSMVETLRLLLATVSDDQISQATLDSWMSIIYTPEDSSPTTFAQQGCSTTVESPNRLISVADRTVWMHVDGEAAAPMQLDFLYPSEKAELIEKNLIDLWDEAAQNKWQQDNLMAPLLHTRGQLIIVTCKHRGGEPAQKHPLIVRLLQQIENYDDIVCRPTIEAEYLEEVTPIRKKQYDGEMQINPVPEEKFPDHHSPTSMESLVCHPFDYVMDKIAGITPDEKAQLNDVRTTRGTVAHGVIEALFAPRDGHRVAKAAEIESRIKAEYDGVFTKVVEQKGAIMQLRENQLACQLLRRQLKDCLSALLDIIRTNSLSVVGCEQFCKHDDLIGFMDMTFEDADHHPVVFDFKWTSSKSYHRSLLEKNRSIQLETYRYLLSRETKDEVKRVAYFLMPKAHLYSKEHFDGKHCTQVTSENRNEIMPQVLRSIAYRKEQLLQGCVEMPGAFDTLQYVKDTESKGLFPLEEDENTGMQSSNIFSNYKLFQ